MNYRDIIDMYSSYRQPILEVPDHDEEALRRYLEREHMSINITPRNVLSYNSQATISDCSSTVSSVCSAIETLTGANPFLYSSISDDRSDNLVDTMATIKDFFISENDAKNLHEYAKRASGGRCGTGCTGCPANDIRKSGENGACLIRRLARIPNSYEQIKWLVDNYSGVHDANIETSNEQNTDNSDYNCNPDWLDWGKVLKNE